MLEKLGSDSLVIIKEGKEIFRSAEGMLSPIIACISKHRKEMENSVAIDKVVGLAAAKLFEFAKVSEVHAKVASRKAAAFFGNLRAETEVEMIISNNAQCPMEKLAEALTGKELFEKLNKQ